MDALVGPIRSKLLEYGTIETMLTYQTDRSQMWDPCVAHGPTFHRRSCGSSKYFRGRMALNASFALGIG